MSGAKLGTTQDGRSSAIVRRGRDSDARTERADREGSATFSAAKRGPNQRSGSRSGDSRSRPDAESVGSCAICGAPFPEYAVDGACINCWVNSLAHDPASALNNKVSVPEPAAKGTP